LLLDKVFIKKNHYEYFRSENIYSNILFILYLIRLSHTQIYFIWVRDRSRWPRLFVLELLKTGRNDF